MFKKILFVLIIFCAPSLYAQETPLTLDLQNMNVADAIHALAVFLDKEIILSPLIQGKMTLHLQNESPSQSFQAVLTANHLGIWPMGHIWLIAPREELIKYQQDVLQWQTAQEESANLKTQMWCIHYAKANDIAHLLQDEKISFLSKRGHLQADVRTNRIFLQDTPRQINLVNQFIHEMDVPVPQIDIEVKLASVDYDYERDLGLTFMQTSPDESASTETQGQSRYSLAIAHLPGSALLTVKLAALENAGHAELISSPSLFTANQETASIEAGEEVPYQEVSQSGGTAVVFKKAVLGLKVTPQLLPDKKVLLQLQINQDRPNNKTVLGMPTISTRQIISHVLVKHGQTIVLGGIYELDTQNAEERVPFLSNLPGIGLLFKQQNIKKRKRELLIFVTPKVIA